MIDPADFTVTIVDGHVDEPVHSGVSPYISTHPRFTAGAVVDAGVLEPNVVYHTIDELHEDRQKWHDAADVDLMVHIGGMTVPDKYVDGTPVEPDEMCKLVWAAEGTALMGGPIRFGAGDKNAGGQDMERKNPDCDFVAKGDIEAVAYDPADSGLEGFDNRMCDNEEPGRWAVMGAFVVERHPSHPDHLTCEMETSRGCAYHCSFCIEPLHGNPAFRTVDSVVKEVENLYDRDARYFRLDRQVDTFAFGGDGEAPNPDVFYRFYGDIREVALDLGTPHLDNVSSITIVGWPEKPREALHITTEYNTAGDIAAFGSESADPVVQEENNPNVIADECLEAVKIANEVASWRSGDDPVDVPTHGLDVANHLPKLLPDINLLHGLKGGCKETFEHSRRSLQRVYDEDLMVRRINIQQVMVLDGIDMSDTGADIACDHKQLSKTYRMEAREEIDRPMPRRIAPAGTVPPNVHLEYHQGGRTFGRQLGTYSFSVGILGERELGKTIDVVVVDYGYRSVIGVPYPPDFNEASMDEFTAIPGTGWSTAGDIVMNCPYVDAVNVGVDADVTEHVQ